METATSVDIAYRLSDRPDLALILEEQFVLMGIEYDPAITAEQAREMMLAEGINPASNAGSQEIAQMREE